MKVTVTIWDWPLRVFHWLLVIAVVGGYVTGKLGGHLTDWHGRLGSLVLGLLVFRLIWGFIGTTHARFSSFFPIISALWLQSREFPAFQHQWPSEPYAIADDIQYHVFWFSIPLRPAFSRQYCRPTNAVHLDWDDRKCWPANAVGDDTVCCNPSPNKFLTIKQNWTVASENFSDRPRLPLVRANHSMSLSIQSSIEPRRMKDLL